MNRLFKEICGIPIHGIIGKIFNNICFDSYMRYQIWYLRRLGVNIDDGVTYICPDAFIDSSSYSDITINKGVVISKQVRVIRHNENLNYIFISPYQEKQLLRRIPEVKHKYLVKNPINVGERKQIEAEKNSNFVYIGRLSGEKGPQLFCEAVTKAGVHGVIIGKGILEEDLKQKYPNIEFMGWQNKEQINEHLKKTRALIFPTLWYEGSPLTVPEVQANGIPCIVTDCSSATDDIVQGENGEIVKANADAMTAAINRFKDDDYVKRLSRNTYQMFDENRGSEKWYVDNLLKIYAELERRRQFTYV